MHFAMENGQICFSLRKFLAISLAIQKIASDCGCDAVVHLDLGEVPRYPDAGKDSMESVVVPKHLLRLFLASKVILIF